MGEYGTDVVASQDGLLFHILPGLLPHPVPQFVLFLVLRMVVSARELGEVVNGRRHVLGKWVGDDAGAQAVDTGGH
uniref:Uncharacterized protein n=1 Tax=Nymphaea colorata TaxID=210225 RepID=A0A5K1EY03_9MAGN|nr:unnamed protein product [Nymphaea colorata]